jgi:AcrR family transcriptional regulator
MDHIERKEDRRIKRTDRLIFEALCKLTEKKELEKISVSELCNEADISRQAFYSRYRDPIHTVESYIDEIYEQGKELPVPYESPESRSKKLHDLWEDNLPVLKLILVSSKSQTVYEYFIKRVADLYMELNKVPRSDLEHFEQDDLNYDFELSLATLHAKNLKRRLETGSDGTYEKKLMERFFSNLKRIRH